MGRAREAVDRWWELFTAGRFDELATLVGPTAQVIMPGGMRLTGPDQLRPLLQAYLHAFPDIRHEVVDAVEQDDAIAVELRVIGTHTGVMQSPAGSIPPTGKTVVWESVDIVRIANGKIVSWHTYFDQMAVAAQMGLMPPGA